MATTSATSSLTVEPRDAEGSRAARRLRRAGNVPGVVYGGGEDPVAFSVDARILRNTLAHAGHVLELTVGGEAASPVLVKEIVRHPVSGAIQHLDLLRVRMDEKIQATVLIDLTGAESAPGVIEGGVLEQIAREVTIEALPGDIPDTIPYDVSGLEVGGTLLLSELRPPSGVVFVDDPETVVASITAPRLQIEDETEIETETEVVGEGGEAAEGEAGAEGEASGDGDGDGEAGADSEG